MDPNSEKHIRVFICVKPNPELLSKINSIINTLKEDKALKNVRWTPPDNLHVTLKFLGNISEQVVETLAENLRLALADFKPFESKSVDISFFPSAKKAKIVSLNFGDGEPWEDLHKTIDTACAEMGFDSENRPFKPHLTLGRIKGYVPSEPDWPELNPNLPFFVDEILIQRSVTKPDGAEYTTLARIPL